MTQNNEKQAISIPGFRKCSNSSSNRNMLNFHKIGHN